MRFRKEIILDELQYRVDSGKMTLWELAELSVIERDWYARVAREYGN